MSNRSIADVVGVSRETVNRDMNSGDTNVPPEPRPVIGQDGKTYPLHLSVPVRKGYPKYFNVILVTPFVTVM